MLIEGQSAYLLHCRKYTDSRIILELLTEQYGRVSGVFRYKQSAKKSTPIQAFTSLYVDWKGNAGLKTFLNVEPYGKAIQLRSKNLYCALYLNEILQRVLPQEDACDSVFILYAETINNLAKIENDMTSREACLRVFELNLLEQLGFAINFVEDVSQDLISQGKSYRYVVGEGFAPNVSAREGGFSAEIIIAIREYDFSDPTVLKYAKHLCRQALQPLIGNRALNSRDFFR